MKYIVKIKETWIQSVRVEAESESDAVEKVLEGAGDYLEGPDGFEFQNSQDSDMWDVEEE